ncbi:MAG: tyrosine-type recombinase/integrase [Nitrososphaeraceae archaeon]
MNFLTKNKTKESYVEKIANDPIGTQRNKLYSIRNLERFVESKHHEALDDIINQLLALSTDERQTALYDILQDWINWNYARRVNNSTTRAMFSFLRRYLYYRGMKTDPQDIKENLRFGKKRDEERYPLSKKEYQEILNYFSRNPKRQALYLVLGSSGMRIGEALRLRKKDLDFARTRVKVNIHADITKTKAGRTTYISKEAEEKLRPILEKLKPNDLIFKFAHTNNRFHATIAESSVLGHAVDKLGFGSKYESNKRRKITSHSFRSYFFTAAVRKHGENYAHRLTGHGGYLTQYDRMTEDEKLKMYLELEPDLLVFDQTKNELEIKQLKEKNEILSDLEKEIKKLRETQANQDKIIVDLLRKNGVLPK